MSVQGIIKRYTRIIEKVSFSQNPSLETIRSFLQEEDFSVSKRTIERDFEDIKYEFGIAIEYNQERKGYYINKERSANVESFLRLLEIAGTASILSDCLKDGTKALKYISFESQGNLKGIHFLKPMLFAVKNHKVVTFTYQKFTDDTLKKYTLQPYLLKEYQSRWYFVGIRKGDKDFTTFGIDRIVDFTVLKEKFKPDEALNALERYDNAIGLTSSGNDAEEIILSVTPLETKYLKALPLHRSQEIIKETENETIIRLFVIPNFELTQKILMLRDEVKVLKPEKLRNEIAGLLRKMLKAYKKNFMPSDTV